MERFDLVGSESFYNIQCFIPFAHIHCELQTSRLPKIWLGVRNWNEFVFRGSCLLPHCCSRAQEATSIWGTIRAGNYLIWTDPNQLYSCTTKNNLITFSRSKSDGINPEAVEWHWGDIYGVFPRIVVPNVFQWVYSLKFIEEIVGVRSVHRMNPSFERLVSVHQQLEFLFQT